MGAAGTLVAAVLAAPIYSAVYAADPDPVVVLPGLGPVAGKTLDGDVSVFLGLPFAAPPTGDLRWMPPQPHGGWGSATLNATVFGASCPQGSLGERSGDGRQRQGHEDGRVIDMGCGRVEHEDCLFLNVAAPTATLSSADSKLPVMIWIHGGGYQEGDSCEYRIESLAAASHGSVIVVSVNYRLGPFGFLGGREVAARTNGGGAGNFGIEDQRFAMRWVKDHISGFGGNGDDITIFGESAGGNSVFNHLAQPASFPLYQKAIIESGLNDEGARTGEDAQDGYLALLKTSNCSDMDCLLAKNISEILGADRLIPPNSPGRVPGEPGGCCSGPTIDGVSLTASPAALIASKQYHSKARVLIGSNRDEMAFMFYGSMPAQLNEQMMQFTVMRNPPWLYNNMSLYEEFKQVYDPANYSYPPAATDPDAKFSTMYWMVVRSGTDTIPGLGACAVRWMDRMLLAGGTPAVYSYLFAHPPHGNPVFGPDTFAAHTAELGFVFNEPYGGAFPGAKVFTQEEAVLAKTVSGYWLSFAKTGDPNPSPTGATDDGVGGGAPTWPQYSQDGDETLRLQTASEGGVVVESGLRKAACDWQDKIKCDPPSATCRSGAGGGGGR